MADSSDSIKRSLNSNSLELLRASSKLASGKRINMASDDAAGLAVAESLAAEVKISSKASRNIGDAQSAIAIADGAMGQLSDIGSRLASLATQSANGTLNDEQRKALQDEFGQLTQEASRIVSTTSFNGKQLLNKEDIVIQAGTDGSGLSQLALSGVKGTDLANSLSSLNIGSQAQAASSIEGISSFISNVASQRGSLGAVSSRLSTADNKLAVKSEAQLAAKSRIEDLDVAEGVAIQIAAQVRQKNSSALLAQANQNKDTVLKLLS